MSSHQDDLFDSVTFFEENCQKQGYKDGFEKGKLVGWKEGFQIGVQKGHKVGAEIGFYEGFIVTWLAGCELTGNHRVKSKVESLLKIFSEDWSDNSKDLIQRLETVRAKFKQICSMLNISTEYTQRKEYQLSF